MNKIAEFQKEVRMRIRKNANNRKLKRLSAEWLEEADICQYEYNFSWLGRPIIQLPQDIVAMQELIWRTQPDLIVETGVAHGGGLVLYASILELIGGEGQVVGIDIDIRSHNRVEIEKHPMFKRIVLLEGSSTSKEIVDQVYDLANSRNKILVCLDSNHTHKHVFRELELYSPLVTKGSYIVVSDTSIEHLSGGGYLDRPWGKGDNPRTAVWEFLDNNDRFEVDKKIENKLLITSVPEGYLKCIKE